MNTPCNEVAENYLKFFCIQEFDRKINNGSVCLIKQFTPVCMF